MVELMIVVGIVAILLALAYPSYIQYVRKSKRGEAQQLLMNWSINQEIWRSNHTTYASTDDLPAPTHDDYDFEILDRGASTYTLRASAKNDQLNDREPDGYCGKAADSRWLEIDESGAKTPASCWE